MTELEIILDKLSKLESLLLNKSDVYESNATSELNAALAKAQESFSIIKFNRENSYFKTGYADLEVVLNSVRPILAQNGLSLTQRTLLPIDGTTILQTRLWHSTGQWIESRARIIPPKNDLHSYASTENYIKRFQILSILGIAVHEDPFDDDAENAMAEARQIIAKGTDLNLKYNPKKESADTITKEQLEELEYELGEFMDIADEIMDRLHLRSLAELPKSMYQITITRVREIKNARQSSKYGKK